MLKKTLLGAAALAAGLGTFVAMGPGRRDEGVPRRHPRRRKRSRSPEETISASPTRSASSFKRRSSSSRPPTMTALSRASSAARSTSPSLARPGGSSRSDTFDINQFAADLAGALAKECPISLPNDVAAQQACRKNIGQGPEKRWRDGYVLFGGQQPSLYWLRDKKTSVFRGDIFEDLYMSLYMYTGKYNVTDAPDGLKVIHVEAYFRNGLPPGRYPYPFWHSAAKWLAYEKSNELRFRVTTTGKVEFAYRADTGSDADGRLTPMSNGRRSWVDGCGVTIRGTLSRKSRCSRNFTVRTTPICTISIRPMSRWH